MKKVIALIGSILLLVGVASGYYVNLTVPEKVNLGDEIVVKGESNLPPGHSTTIIFASSGSFPRVIAQNEIVIQADGGFSTVFQTKGLSKGLYKVEIQESGQYTYGSNSKTWRIFEILDRSNELKVTSPLTQIYDGMLEIAGKLENAGDAGVEITVKLGAETVYGPVYISTRNGEFSAGVAIERAGTYGVTLKDSTGYRWTFEVTVSPVETPVPATTTVTTTRPVLTERSNASRTEPAFFEISTLPGNLTVTTTGGVDWAIECIDENGQLITQNTRGTSPERMEIPTRGGRIYLKVYPDLYGVKPEITITVENALSIRKCPECASRFGEQVTSTQSTPLSPMVALLALILVLIRRR